MSTITDLMGAYDLRDLGVMPGFNEDQAGHISAALEYISQRSPANGIAFLRPGVYRVDTPPIIPSNITVIGAGSSSEIKLANSKYSDVLSLSGISNTRLKDLRINGNRSNNSGGNGGGLVARNCEDVWLENVDVISCRGDGIAQFGCEGTELLHCRVRDNGRHGALLNYSTFCTITGGRYYNNSRVSPAFTGNGIHLEVLSTDNTVLGALCYETALIGGLQGYGVNEQPSTGCSRNHVIGVRARGNRIDQIRLDPDSLSMCWELSQVPGIVIPNGPVTPTYTPPALGTGYLAKLLATRPNALIGLWPLAEQSGLVAYDFSGNGYDGAYNANVTLNGRGIGDGTGASQYNGSNAVMSMTVAGFFAAGKFSQAKGTALVWGQYAGTWNDGETRALFEILDSGGENKLLIFKRSDGATLNFRRITNNGGEEQDVITGAQTTTDYLCLAITWDVDADEFKAYMGGVQEGATQTGLAAFAIAANAIVVGGGNVTPVQPWHGGGAYLAIWNEVLSQGEISPLGTPI